MIYYLIKIIHHHITEEFGTIDYNDPYDHYIGSTDEQTNMRFRIVNDVQLADMMDDMIPADPFDYDDIIMLCEFHYDHEVARFIKCMSEVQTDELFGDGKYGNKTL